MAILDFEAFLRLPNLDRKAIIGMLAGSEVMKLEQTCTTRECRKALLEAYEDTEVFGLKMHCLSWYCGHGNYKNPEEL